MVQVVGDPGERRIAFATAGTSGVTRL